MEPVTRQITTQSNKSFFIVALDQNGPMVSQTMETIHCHDNHDDDDDNGYDDITLQYNNDNKKKPSQSLNKTMTIQSDTTIQPYDEKSIISNNTTNTTILNTTNNIPPWQFWKKDAGKANPKSFSTSKKYFILLLVAIAGSSSPLASTIYYPALIDMQKAFNSTDTLMNASISIFTFFTAFFPLLWAALGERYGRRMVYLISFTITVIGSLLCGLSVNMVMFIIFRAISAIGSSSVLSMGAGTLSDVFEAHERGNAFAWYTCGPLLGPALGPIIGGFLNNGLGYKSIFYFLAIFNFVILFGIFFFLPETSQPTFLEQNSGNQTLTNNNKKRKPMNPLSALNLFLNKNIALSVCFVGILFFSLYIVSTTFSRTYAALYGFESSIVGLCYLPNAIGCMVGGMTGGRLSDKRYVQCLNKLNESNDEEIAVENQTNNNTNQHQHQLKRPSPEARLGGIIFYGSILIQLLAITAFGWCIQERVHFAFGLVCQFFYGFSLMLPNVVLNTYMVDCFRKRGASVTACNNFVRYFLAGIGSLVSSDLEKAMGPGPMYTFIGVLLMVFSVNLVLVQLKGNTWRQQKMRKQQEKGLKVDTLP
ncbi:major facilitator superfamily domain-containing protein [Cunninghamella echinulata]|nr:major facilitator superfamily domain-containing protein [Cunninghamella echinulata]